MRVITCPFIQLWASFQFYKCRVVASNVNSFSPCHKRCILIKMLKAILCQPTQAHINWNYLTNNFPYLFLNKWKYRGDQCGIWLFKCSGGATYCYVLTHCTQSIHVQEQVVIASFIIAYFKSFITDSYVSHWSYFHGHFYCGSGRLPSVTHT